MDIIFIQDLAVEAVIGVTAAERSRRQLLRLSLEMAADIRAAAVSDRLDDTVDYYAVAQRLSEYAADTECHLLEALAEQLAMLVMAEFGVSWLRLTLAKPGALEMASEAGVTIERGERG